MSLEDMRNIIQDIVHIVSGKGKNQFYETSNIKNKKNKNKKQKTTATTTTKTQDSENPS